MMADPHLQGVCDKKNKWALRDFLEKILETLSLCVSR